MTDPNNLANILAVLDVGHGNSTVICTDDHVALVDVGPGSGILEFVTRHNIKTIQTVYLSHADKDHIGGLAGLLSSKEVTMNQVFLNSDALKGSDEWNDLLYELDAAHNAKELKFEVALVDNTSDSYGDVVLEVLAPSRYLAGRGPGSTDREGRKLYSNSISAVIRVMKNGEPVAVLPGDLDNVGLQNLLASEVDAQAPVLVFPHHGGRPGTDNIQEFVDQLCGLVNPEIVLFSIDRNKQKFPRPEIVEAIRQALPHVRFACTQLSAYCSKSLASDDYGHLSDLFALGREDSKCCGGTITVNLDNPTQLTPTVEQHQAFIERNAESALCYKSGPADSEAVK